MSIKTKRRRLPQRQFYSARLRSVLRTTGYIISPFSLGCDFNSIAAGKLISADAESTYNKAAGSLSVLPHTAGTADIEIRSGYKDGESIINDNLTGTAGDNYIYYTPKSGNRKWPGGLFFCSTQTSNPEKSRSATQTEVFVPELYSLEFDMRIIQPGADDPSELNTAKRMMHAEVSLLFTAGKSGADGTAASGKGVTGIRV